MQTFKGLSLYVCAAYSLFRTDRERRCELVCALSAFTTSPADLRQRVLRYVKSAVGETDVPEDLPEFISQRRRWLNGSFFASVYAIAHTGQVLRSGHSLSRKLMLIIETLYNIINLIFAWFALVSAFILDLLIKLYWQRPTGKLLFVLRKRSSKQGILESYSHLGHHYFIFECTCFPSEWHFDIQLYNPGSQDVIHNVSLELTQRSTYTCPSLLPFSVFPWGTDQKRTLSCFPFLVVITQPLHSAPWKYKISAILFAIINVYAIFCAVLAAMQAAKQGGAVYSAMLFSVIITYGCESMFDNLASKLM